MLDLFLVKKVSRKEGKEPFTYVQLIADLGYEKVVISMDKDVISKVLDCPVSALYKGEENQQVKVAVLKFDSKQLTFLGAKND